jgi:hypothetical protein
VSVLLDGALTAGSYTCTSALQGYGYAAMQLHTETASTQPIMVSSRNAAAAAGHSHSREDHWLWLDACIADSREEAAQLALVGVEVEGTLQPKPQNMALAQAAVGTGSCIGFVYACS